MPYYIPPGVKTFNLRRGDVTLTYEDVTGALGFIPGAASGSVVISFNTRSGSVTLLSSDVSSALGFQPMSPSGTILSASHAVSASNATTVTSVTSAQVSSALGFQPVSTSGSITGHAQLDLSLTGGLLTGPLTGTTVSGTIGAFTSLTVNGATIAMSGSGVTSWNTRSGDVTLLNTDVSSALGFQPVSLSGSITGNAGTVTTVSSSQIVAALGFTPAVSGSGVTSLNTRSGAVTLLNTDVSSALGFQPVSPSGSITGNAATVTTVSSSQIVAGLGFTPAVSGSGVTSFNTRSGAVTLLNTDVSSALGFQPVSPSGTILSASYAVTASYAVSASNATTVTSITTAQVTSALGFTPAISGSGVTSLNTRSGDVTLLNTDVSSALSFQPISPSGSITGNAGSVTTVSSSQIVASLGFTPAVSGSGVTSWNSRSGAVTLLNTDVSSALGFQPVSPSGSITGNAGTVTTVSSSQIVAGLGFTPAISGSGVTSFNARVGDVTLNNSDVTGALGYIPSDSSVRNVDISNDTTATSYRYPTFSSITAGNTALNTADSKLTFLPQNGKLFVSGGIDMSGTISGTAATFSSVSVNDMSVLTGISGTQVSSALGFQPVSPSGSITGHAQLDLSLTGGLLTGQLTGTVFSGTTGAFTSLTVNGETITASGSGVTSFNTRSGSVTLTDIDVETALGVTTGSVIPDGFLRKAGGAVWYFDQNVYITDISSSQIVTALGFTPAISGSGVTSWNSRSGAVTLLNTDVSSALGFQPMSPSGTILSASYAVTSSYAVSASNATTVTSITAAQVTSALGFTPAISGSGVTSFNTRSGAVTLLNTDVSSALGFQPVSPSGSITGNAGTVTTVSSSQIVAGLGFTPAISGSGVTSWNSRSGAVTLLNTDVSSALGFQPMSPSGTILSASYTVTSSYAVSASNATTVTSITNVQVTSALGFLPAISGSGVTSLNTRSGAVTLTDIDVETALGVTTGTVIPDGFLRKAGGAIWYFDQNAYITGISSSQIITALGFTPAISGSGVTSWNTRSGAVTLLNTDVSSALGFQPMSPSGTILSASYAVTASYAVSASNATTVTSITTAQVTSALGFTPAVSGSGVTSLNTRSGAVTLLNTDVSSALGFQPVSPSGSITGNAGTVTTVSSSQIVAGLGFTPAISGSGVTSLNTRSGAVTLLNTDVSSALGFQPVSPSGSITGLAGLNLALTGGLLTGQLTGTVFSGTTGAFTSVTSTGAVSGTSGTFTSVTSTGAVSGTSGTFTSVTSTGAVSGTSGTFAALITSMTSTFAQEAWTAFSGAGYQNFWHDWGGQWQVGSFMKDSMGVVCVRGSIMPGNTGQVFYTLPTGYRPALTMSFAANQASTAALVLQITPAGAMSFIFGNTVPGGRCSIDGIMFDTRS